MTNPRHSAAEMQAWKAERAALWVQLRAAFALFEHGDRGGGAESAALAAALGPISAKGNP